MICAEAEGGFLCPGVVLHLEKEDRAIAFGVKHNKKHQRVRVDAVAAFHWRVMETDIEGEAIAEAVIQELVVWPAVAIFESRVIIAVVFKDI
jgi:hypothetical protein